MQLTREEGRLVIYGDHEEWSSVDDTEEVVERSRWSVRYTGVFLHCPSGTHYRLYWSVGATEQQDEQAYEYDDPEPIKVVAKRVIVTQWVRADG